MSERKNGCLADLCFSNAAASHMKDCHVHFQRQLTAIVKSRKIMKKEQNLQVKIASRHENNLARPIKFKIKSQII